MGAGLSLFNLGVKLLWQTETASDLYFFPFWVLLCLYVGFLKGRFVLTKSAIRIVNRLKGLQQPIPLWKLYSVTTWVLLLSMVGVSQAMKVFEVSFFLRGSIDLAVGMALIKGSLSYFQQSIQMQDLRYL